MRRLDIVEQGAQRRDLPPFRVGDTVRVHVKVREGAKERIQVFEGVCIRRRGGAAGETFTVRKISNGVGVERIFPTQAPTVAKVEIKRRGYVRRSRLYYLRNLTGKKARLHSKVRDLTGLISEEEAEAMERAERGEDVPEPAPPVEETEASAEAAGETGADAAPEAEAGPGTEAETEPQTEPQTEPEKS